MGVVKQFTSSPRFRSASKKALRQSLPSDCLFSFGGALFDKSNKTKRYAEKEFLRKSLDIIMKTVKSLRILEDRYYGN